MAHDANAVHAHVAQKLRGWLGPQAALAVACSGGVDSVVLAHIAAGLRKLGALTRVTLFHVDHQLRAESHLDAAFVTELAGRLGVTCAVETVEVPAQASVEDAARTARYAAFERLMAATGHRHVALAHTEDDQAETILMRIIRGTGVKGLRGIPAQRGGFIRPLLTCSRAQVEQYAHSHQLRHVDDASNQSERFFRNRIRHRWLPLLSEENPKLREALVRLGASAQETHDHVDSAASALVRTAKVEGGFSWDVTALKDPVVAKAGFTEAAGSLGVELQSTHLDALWALCSGSTQGTKSLDLPRLTATRVYDQLMLSAPAKAGSVPQPPIIIEPECDSAAYSIRSWRHGDRFRPVRLQGKSRKISDLFSDAKVPRDYRKHARVVQDRKSQEIVWVEYIGASFRSPVSVSLTTSPSMATNKSEGIAVEAEMN